MTRQSSLILRSNSTQHRPHLPLRSWSFRLKPLTKRTFDVHEIRRMWTVVPSRRKVVSRGRSRSHPIRIATTFHRTSPFSAPSALSGSPKIIWRRSSLASNLYLLVNNSYAIGNVIGQCCILVTQQDTIGQRCNYAATTTHARNNATVKT